MISNLIFIQNLKAKHIETDKNKIPKNDFTFIF
jgi:hypothetical protein